MDDAGFRKIYWGFLFMMIDFRIQGFDILPDIVGFILFAAAFSILADSSDHFVMAARYNLPMVFLSLFTLYDAPVQGGGVTFGYLGPWGLLVFIASLILTLLVVYNLLAGIKQLAAKQLQQDLVAEADSRWNEYLLLQIGTLLAFFLLFIPFLAVLATVALLVAAIVITIRMMGLIRSVRNDF